MTEHETRIHRNRSGDAISGAALIAVYNASKGDVTWVLGEDGKRIAAIVPVDTAEFVLANLPLRHGRAAGPEGEAVTEETSSMTIRNPVLVWQNELRPQGLPHPDPPAEPFTVTRSAALIRAQGTVVYIWYAPKPASPA